MRVLLEGARFLDRYHGRGSIGVLDRYHERGSRLTPENRLAVPRFGRALPAHRPIISNHATGLSGPP